MEPQPEPDPARVRDVVGPAAQHREVAGDQPVARDRLLRGRVQLEVGRVDQHGGGGEGVQLAELLGGEAGLRGAAAAEHGDPLHRGPGQRVQDVLRHVGGGQLARGAGQHPGDVQRDVSHADDDDVPGPADGVLHERAVGVGVPAVPGHDLGGRQAAGQVLALDAQPAVTGRAVGVDDGVHVPAQLGQGEVLADLDVADEAHPLVVQRVVQGVAQRAHLGVVGGDAVAHQPERRGQPVDQVDGDRDVVLPGQCVGGVDARRTGADDGDPQWTCAPLRVRHTSYGGPAAPVCTSSHARGGVDPSTSGRRIHSAQRAWQVGHQKRLRPTMTSVRTSVPQIRQGSPVRR